MTTANTGIRKRLRAYFEANPSEELTKDDMMVKFGATESGLLERASVYRLAKAQA